MTVSIQEKLDRRYGRGRAGGSRRAWWIGGGIAIAAAIAIIAWFTWSATANQVDADTTGFETIDSHSVTVDFQVTSTQNKPIACALEAQDVEHGVVGWKIVEIPASADQTRLFVETIPTVAEATTGLVSSCWIP